MSLIDYLKLRTKSAKTAKNRLQVLIAHERSQNSPNFLLLLKKDILAAIEKHTGADMSQVEVDLRQNKEQHSNSSILELNVVLPEENIKGKKKATSTV